MTTLDLVTREDLEQFKTELFDLLKKTGIATSSEIQKQWLKNAEVRKMLKISPSTLQNLRINGTLRYTKIGGIYYYKHEDIVNVLEENQSN